MVEWFVDAIVAYQLIHHNTKRIEFQNFKYDHSISFDSKKPSKNSKKIVNSKIGFFLNRSKEISNNFFDIRDVKGKLIPRNIDIFTYSFPCQDLSNQGKQKGMSDKSNTRSSLLWQIKRILIEMQETFSANELPKYLLMENVLAIKNKNHNFQYQKWIETLKEIGYVSKEYVLDSKHFNSPQSRKRVFLLSIQKDFKNKINFNFKEIEGNNNFKKIKDILENNLSYSEKLSKYSHTSFSKKETIKAQLINYTNFSSENTIYDINGIGPTLTASGALSRIKLFFGEKQIRYMSPLESFRYMGFNDKDFKNVNEANLITKNKQYFIMGNSIVVNVLEAIFNTLEFKHEQ